jgi:sugar fermentation stimulation protein A
VLLPFDPPLRRARFRARRKRFFADCEFDGAPVVAHCANTGSMKTLLNDGVDAWLRPGKPGARLAWQLVLLGTPDGGLALIDTQLPNALIAAGVAAGRVPALAGYDRIVREAPLGAGRCDLRLEAAGRTACVVEIKNVSMAGSGDRAEFPDAVTERGARHLAALAEAVRSGLRAVQCYLLARTDRSRCGIAAGIDPAYFTALQQARAAGVETLVLPARLGPDGADLGPECPLDAP